MVRFYSPLTLRANIPCYRTQSVEQLFVGQPSWFDANVTSEPDRKLCAAPSSSAPPPYMSVIALNDTVIGHTPEEHLADETWHLAQSLITLAPYAYVNDAVLNDLDVFSRMRAPLMCGESPSPPSPSAETDQMKLYSACGGAAAVAAIKGASDDGTCPSLSQGHCVNFLQAHLGCSLLDFAVGWLATGETCNS